MREGIAIVAIAALVTVALRFAPFLVFDREGPIPSWAAYLGRVLPSSIMAMLAVYCLRGLSFESLEGFLPELISCLVVALLQIFTRKSIVSILGGTACYMLLIRLIS